MKSKVTRWLHKSILKPIGVFVLENWFRTKDRRKMLALRLKGQSSVKSIRGMAHLTRDKVVIFAAYPTGHLAQCHIRFLERFHARGYDVVVATGHAQPERVFAGVLDRPWVFVFRHPLGRDFGAYKDVSLLLHRLSKEEGRRYKKVVYLNDSVLTFDAGEEALISFLDQPDEDFLGITENHHKGHHVSSYMMAVGERAFYDPASIAYWMRYRSYSTRRYAIGAGELGFSRMMKKYGYEPRLLLTVSPLKVAMMQLPVERLLMIAQFMEPHFRQSVGTPFDLLDQKMPKFFTEGNLSQNQKSSASKNSMSEGFEIDSIDKFYNFVDLQVVNRHFVSNFKMENQIKASADFSKSDFVDEILHYVLRGSQVHHGAALILFMGLGLMKKDVVLRGLVDPFNLDHLLLTAAEIDDVALKEARHEVLLKGRASSFRGYQRLLLSWDFI